ncbi:MAPEG family protein [Lysobacter yangpyeongensis]|uniref:MAPEG family protein n=2 Tax=Lysobacter yangpyeongensis TaxID=346182 RepID=A0ABW0SPI7_9GAMM
MRHVKLMARYEVDTSALRMVVIDACEGMTRLAAVRRSARSRLMFPRDRKTKGLARRIRPVSNDVSTTCPQASSDRRLRPIFAPFLARRSERFLPGAAMMTNALLVPMAAHVALTATLYVLLTVARAPAIWEIGRSPDGSNPMAKIEPRISANLSNQFEWPLFFHVACLVLALSDARPAALVLAWVFVAGRVLHSLVQILTTNVRLRGIVFTINFAAVLGLWWLAMQPVD